MIAHYYRAKYQTQIKMLESVKAGVWVHCEMLSSIEISRLTEEYGLDAGAIADALDPYEVPRTVSNEGWTYLYVRAPKESFKEGATVPLCIAVGPEYIVTIAQDSMSEMWNRVLSSDLLTTQKTRVVCAIIGEISKMYHRDVAGINRKLRRYANNDTYTDNNDVLQMLTFEKSLNDFLDALVPMSTIMGNILLGKSLVLFKQDRDIVEDIQLTLEQLIGWSKSTLRTIQNTREAYSTILSNRLNQNIHHLTIITIVLAIPTMVAGLYGMNVQLPGSESSAMFYVIIILSLLMSLVIYNRFKRKS